MLVKACPELANPASHNMLQKDSHNDRHKWDSDKKLCSVPEPQMPVLKKLDK